MISRRDVLISLAGGPAFAALVSGRSQPSDDLVWRDVAALTALVRRRAVTRLEVVEAFLRRIERLDARLNAFVTVTATQARDQAGRADTAGTSRGSLDGVPIAHKDLFETAGVRTTAGSRLFERHVPGADATVVARLARAGAVSLGKTNTHELGGGVTTINPFFGTSRNPWDLARIAGGSSGGSAVAVAAGLVVAATGSDTGGSVRIPAAFCGCVGFKPTYGRLSTAGLLGASPTFDHGGLLARTVADAAILYRAAAGYDAADPSTVPDEIAGTGAQAGDSARRPSRLRVGVARNFFFDELAPDVARAVEKAIDGFRSLRADVRDIRFPIDGDTMAQVFDPIVVAEIHQRFAADWRDRPEMFSTSFAGFFEAPVPTGLELAAAHRALRDYQRSVRARFEDLDLVVTPTVPVTAPLIDGPIPGGLLLRNAWPFNAARTPALTVPCGVDAAGLPVGLQLAAAPYADPLLLAAARDFEQLGPWVPGRPVLA